MPSAYQILFASDDPSGRPSPPQKYVVSDRVVDALGGLETAGPERRRLAGVVSDAPSLQVFLRHSLGPDFEVVVADRLDVLAAALGDRQPDLIAADLYTLDHHGPDELSRLDGTFGGVPLLIASQDPVRQAEARRLGSVPPVIVPLPVPASLVRQLAQSTARPAG